MSTICVLRSDVQRKKQNHIWDILAKNAEFQSNLDAAPDKPQMRGILQNN